MSNINLDFSLTFQEYSLVSDCLHNTLADIERKEYLAKQPLSIQQKQFVNLIKGIADKLDQQAMSSSSPTDMMRITSEMDKATRLSEEFLAVVKDANGNVWLSIKGST